MSSYYSSSYENIVEERIRTGHDMGEVEEMFGYSRGRYKFSVVEWISVFLSPILD